MNMERPDLKEYDVLSEDRRRAVEIYIKGVLIVAAIYAFGIKLLIDSTNLLTIIIIGAIGLIMIPFQIVYWSKCRKHDQNINLRLTEIGGNIVSHLLFALNTFLVLLQFRCFFLSM